MSKPSFRNLFHSSQNDSGLIPPFSKPARKKPETVLERSIEDHKKLWESQPTTPSEPTLSERQVAARDEAIACMQDSQADNTNLIAILKVKHGLAQEHVVQIVKEAQAEIGRGAKEDV